MDSWSLLCFLAESDSNEYKAYPMLPKAPRKAQTPPPPTESFLTLSEIPRVPSNCIFFFWIKYQQTPGFLTVDVLDVFLVI